MKASSILFLGLLSIAHQSALALGTDLKLTVIASPSVVSQADTINLSVNVDNIGSKVARTIVVTQQLPDNTTFQSASKGCRFASKRAKRLKKLTCRTNRLRPGESKNWTVALTGSSLGEFSSVSSVKFHKKDADTSNNSVETQIGVGPAGNKIPRAHSLSFNADPAVPYLQPQLIGDDADNDTLNYDLSADISGVGYDFAYLNPQSGVLYVSIAPNFTGQITLPYRVTDGKVYSATADVLINVEQGSDDKGTGAQEVDAKTYSTFDRSHLASNLLGAPGAPPTEPEAVDLSGDFPTPGDQGQQGSCVAWATGYALKSYQEQAEMNWSLNTNTHLFSPAFIYNQINGGQDNGSQIYDALDLIIEKGAATLDRMPYTDQDFTATPSQAAFEQASKFKALKRSTLSNLSDLKGALAQRKPVVLGIEVYDQFYNLKGENSVYNSTNGNNNGPHGRHAVTAVGYDNNKVGGAVKVINSWGTGWGDGGFFWMPYDFFPQVTFQMWILEDGPNGDVTPTPDPVPPDNGDLPDLQIKNWSADLDYNIGGHGELEWEVLNGGTGEAPSGITVSLLLSTDSIINANDTYVVYEAIPFSMDTGGSAYRSIDEGNGIEFQIPQTLEPGDYYMALLVDDQNDVRESDENNNVSPASAIVSLSNNSADLSIDTWYASWDDYSGLGELTYEVSNNGGATATAGWNINLVLTDSEFLPDSSANTYKLVSDRTSSTLEAGYLFYRDDSNPYLFDLYLDANGNFIPNGYYYMALWIDDENVVAESDELNNTSYSWGYVSVNSLFGAAQSGASKTANAIAAKSTAAATASSGSHSAYNGKKLPDKFAKARKVRIAQTADGNRTLTFLDTNKTQSTEAPKMQRTAQHLFKKHVDSADKAVFPAAQRQAMPGAAQ
ncbi:C1 family peptidase [Methylomonas rhizoryzae]|uniref:C1 family peptidase n=1 Tax=Methylomonas rhizoryzae TaxID=2608981 RepID=UPI001232BF3E|nr:C1 family peptidase [Methylomonas rhizoryzae]